MANIKYHIKAIFNAIVKADDPQTAREKFIEQALTESPFHLEQGTIDIEPFKSGGTDKK